MTATATKTPPVPSSERARPPSTRARARWEGISPSRKAMWGAAIGLTLWVLFGLPWWWGRNNSPVENVTVSNYSVQETERVLDSPLARLSWPLTAGAADFIGLLRDGDGNFLLDENGKGILDPVWAGHVTGQLMEHLGGFDICKVWLEATASDLVVHFEGEPASPSGSAWLLDCTAPVDPEAPGQVPLVDTPAEGETPPPAVEEEVPGD